MKHALPSCLALSVALTFCSCAGLGGSRTPLRVGVTPNYAPLVFKRGDNVAGLEMDLAMKLSKELRRPVALVELAWEDQIPALLDGRTDIIMSGMSITEERKVRIAFSDPWMDSGLMALTRVKNASKIKSREDVLNFSGRIGVVAGTTADSFVQRECKNARPVKLVTPDDAWFQLQKSGIDIFVHDLPSIIWQVSRHESELTALLQPLNREQIAWGMRRTDTELIANVNDALEKWAADGTLSETILKWIPYYDRIEAAPVAK